MTWREFIATTARACGDSEARIAASLQGVSIESPGFLDQEVKWKPGFNPDECMKVVIERTRDLRQKMNDDPVLRQEVLGAVNSIIAHNSKRN